MKAHILIVGFDEPLMTTRAMLLAQHWSTATAKPSDLTQEIQNKKPSLLLLCHSLSDEEVRSLVRRCRMLSPSTRILCLALGSQVNCLGADATVDGLSGPLVLTKAVERLLGYQNLRPLLMPATDE